MEPLIHTLMAFPWLLWLLKATVIILVGLVVVRFMRKSGPGMRYGIWLTVFGALLILPFIQLEEAGWQVSVPIRTVGVETFTVTSSMQVPDRFSVDETGSAPVLNGVQEDVTLRDESNSSLMLMMSDSIISQKASGETGPATMIDGLKRLISGISPIYLMIGVWCTGILLLLSRLLVGRKQANRLYRDSRFVSGFDWQFVVAFVRKLIRLSAPVDVVQNRDVSIPLTFGVARPVVMLPGSSRKWDLDRRRIVLMHEFVHVKRRDDLIRLLARLVTILYWFHPLVWLAFHHLKEEQEKSCDETVLKSGIRASDYATHLVELTRGLRPIPLAGAATLGMARRKELEGRLTNILDPNLQMRKEIPMKRKLITIAAMAVGVGLLATMHLTARAASWDAVSVDGQMNHSVMTGGDQEKPETPPTPETPEKPATPEEVSVTTEVTVPSAPEKVEKEVLVSVKAPKATWVTKDGNKRVEQIVVDVDSDSPDGEHMFFVKKGDEEVMFVSPDSVDHVRKEVERAMVELKKAMAELAKKKVELGNLDRELEQKLSNLKVDDKNIQMQVQEAMTNIREQLKQQMQQNHQVMEQLQQSMKRLDQQLKENKMTWHAKDDEMTFHIQKLHELDDLKELEKLEVLKELEAIDDEELARKAEAIAKTQEAHAKRFEVIVKAREAEMKAREEAMRKREKEIQEKVEKRIQELEKQGMITEQEAKAERRKAMEEAMRARELELKELEKERLKDLEERREIIIVKQMALEEARMKELEKKLQAHESLVWKHAGDEKDIVVKLDDDTQYMLDDLKGGNLKIAVRIQTEGLEKSELKKLQKAVKKLKKSIPDNVTIEDEVTDTKCTVKLSAKEDATLSDSERDQLDKAVDTFMDAVDEIKGVDEEDVRQIRMIKRDDKHAMTIKQKTD